VINFRIFFCASVEALELACLFELQFFFFESCGWVFGSEKTTLTLLDVFSVLSSKSYEKFGKHSFSASHINSDSW
jgi:hypothetical protein